MIFLKKILQNENKYYINQIIFVNGVVRFKIIEKKDCEQKNIVYYFSENLCHENNPNKQKSYAVIKHNLDTDDKNIIYYVFGYPEEIEFEKDIKKIREYWEKI